MDFGFSAEQDELRSVVRRLLAEAAGEDSVRGWFGVEPGYDRTVWRRLAAEVGVPGLIVDERHGGSSATLVDLGVVIEEGGHRLYGGPLLATAALVPTALALLGGGDIADRYLPGIADGSLVAAIALPRRSADDRLSVRVTAEPDGSAWALTGSVPAVAHGVGADVLLVAATTLDGLGLFAVEAGFSVTALAAFDLTRPLARVDLEHAPALAVGGAGDRSAELRQLLDVAAALLAVEQVGGMQRVLDLSVAHAASRHQFGQPIGAFQAVKHLCAEMLLRLETSRSAAYSALWAASERNAELPASAALALAHCSDAYCAMTSDCIQIHGGMGFTWEHPAHLYLRRARSSAQLLGAPDLQRELLLGHLGLACTAPPNLGGPA